MSTEAETGVMWPRVKNTEPPEAGGAENWFPITAPGERRPLLGFGFLGSESKGNTFLLLNATQFVVTCYSSPRKRIQDGSVHVRGWDFYPLWHHSSVSLGTRASPLGCDPGMEPVAPSESISPGLS